jgi:A/G-specific adenine glycosylase
MPFDFARALLDWFDQHGRKDLPWQQDKTPYRVWVSEIMLQQTQVASVIDYYQRFMARFPSLTDLACAPEDDVLEHWAGLGYYARARNLHKCAQRIHNEMGGKFPDTVEALSALPGIGRSTAGAIISIAHRQRGTILDGNVKRVLCRFYGIDTWSGERETEKKLWNLADALTPEARCDDYTQAIMDLGATLCARSKPDCPNCPMQAHCRAFAEGRQKELPVAKPKKEIPLRHTVLLHIENKAGEILLEKRPPSGIWGGLYSLPEMDHDASMLDLCREKFGIEIDDVEERPTFVHVFSHFRLNIEPRFLRGRCVGNRVLEDGRFYWKSREEIGRIGLPAPISKYLNIH